LAERDDLFREIHDRFYRHVYAYCRRRTRGDAVDDAVADTFFAAWRKSNEIPPGDQALPWLYGVAYRVLSHQWRSAFRRQRLADKLASLGATAVALPEDIVVLRQEARQLLTALDALNNTDREILRLTAWEDLTPREIALVLGISVGAVGQRLYAAKRKLAAEYNRLEGRRTGYPAAQEGGGW
jgi:RNA polymerase sigma-70 factor (ECF subfamily)